MVLTNRQRQRSAAPIKVKCDLQFALRVIDRFAATTNSDWWHGFAPNSCVLGFEYYGGTLYGWPCYHRCPNEFYVVDGKVLPPGVSALEAAVQKLGRWVRAELVKEEKFADLDEMLK